MQAVWRNSGSLGRWGLAPALVCVAAIGCLAHTLYSQQPLIQVDVTLVRIPFVAFSWGGHPLHDLRREELMLSDNGVPQDIKYLWTDVDLPLTVGLLIDVSKSEGGRLVRTYQSSVKWLLLNIIGHPDRASLSIVNEQPRLLSDLASSPDELAKAVEQIVYEGRTGRPFGEPCLPPESSGRNSTDDCIGTPIWDGVFHLARSQFIHVQGRKALVLLSDGMDLSSSVHGLSSAIEAAEAAGVTVYTIKYADLCLPSVISEASSYAKVPQRLVQSLGDRGMQEIAIQTGGRAFTQPRKLESVYRAIEEDLRSQYVLAYTPKPSTPPETWHRVDIHIARPRVKLRALARYQMP